MGYNKLETLAEIFRQKFNAANPQTEIHVSLDEVRGEILRRGEQPPKSLYNFFVDLTRSERGRSTPENAVRAGYLVVRAENGGKFVRHHPNMRVGPVEFPAEITESRIDASAIPELVRPFLRSDEGGLLSAMEYVQVLDRHFGEQPGSVKRIQVPVKVQPNEIDGLFAFRRAHVTVLLPIEAKSKGRDAVLYEQVYGAAARAAALYPRPNLSLLPLAAKIDQDGSLVVLEFEPYAQENRRPAVRRIERYRLHPTPPLWLER